ncbi:unnamed protein product [Acanthoscelides obtectus]|uniref:Uncharacterized protein n=1 Tax=Acanthoscelides obtectus TaxID=200917 RepID=A0A9P0LXE6_ACAOB|nr:unnamed protein product [Acanthoscelides obtectus]CAK1669164.1 hypothetical protein AOBTE_LOCUS26841 [Acanthoscelides obtectus]
MVLRHNSPKTSEKQLNSLMDIHRMGTAPGSYQHFPKSNSPALSNSSGQRTRAKCDLSTVILSDCPYSDTETQVHPTAVDKMGKYFLLFDDPLEDALGGKT